MLFAQPELRWLPHMDGGVFPFMTPFLELARCIRKAIYSCMNGCIIIVNYKCLEPLCVIVGCSVASGNTSAEGMP
jgi:hypothetical protein